MRKTLTMFLLSWILIITTITTQRNGMTKLIEKPFKSKTRLRLKKTWRSLRKRQRKKPSEKLLRRRLKLNKRPKPNKHRLWLSNTITEPSISMISTLVFHLMRTSWLRQKLNMSQGNIDITHLSLKENSIDKNKRGTKRTQWRKQTRKKNKLIT